MLRKRHSATSSWGKRRAVTLTTLMKSIESLGYQGQMAARMDIVWCVVPSAGSCVLNKHTKKAKHWSYFKLVGQGEIYLKCIPKSWISVTDQMIRRKAAKQTLAYNH